MPELNLDDILGPGAFEDYCDASILRLDPPDVPRIYQSRYVPANEVFPDITISSPSMLEEGDWVRTIQDWNTIGMQTSFYSQGKFVAGDGFCMNGATNEIDNQADLYKKIAAICHTRWVEFVYKYNVVDAYVTIMKGYEYLLDTFGADEIVQETDSTLMMHIPIAPGCKVELFTDWVRAGAIPEDKPDFVVLP